jgi:hypothetical protein
MHTCAKRMFEKIMTETSDRGRRLKYTLNWGRLTGKKICCKDTTY